MPTKTLDQLSRRERQIMDIVFKHGRANANQVLQDLPNPPSYTAVRGTLRLLEEKGFLKHEYDGPRYVYVPAVSQTRAKAAAVKHLVRTFFNDSASSAVAAMVGILGDDLTDDDLQMLEKAIENARTKSSGGSR